MMRSGASAPSSSSAESAPESKPALSHSTGEADKVQHAATAAHQPGIPLRKVVASLLVEWGVTSEDSDDSDDFCGWHASRRTATVDELSWLTNGSSAQENGSSLLHETNRSCDVQ